MNYSKALQFESELQYNKIMYLFSRIQTVIMHVLCGLQVTHNASPVTPITNDGTVLKESDDLDILGVTFDSKLTFEKHLRSVSKAASQRLGILRKSW